MIQELQVRGRNPVTVKNDAWVHDAEVPAAQDIPCFPHPAHSPKLNAIEHVRSILERRAEETRPAAGTRRELIPHVEEEWALVPMEQDNTACEPVGEHRIHMDMLLVTSTEIQPFLCMKTSSHRYRRMPPWG